MKIVRDESKLVQFAKLSLGDVFTLDGAYYQKIHIPDDLFNHGSADCAVDINSGIVTTIAAGVYVKPVDGVFVENYVNG